MSEEQAQGESGHREPPVNEFGRAYDPDAMRGRTILCAAYASGVVGALGVVPSPSVLGLLSISGVLAALRRR